MEVLRFIRTHPIARRYKLRTLARIVDWQIRSRLSQEVVVPWIDGQRLAVRRGMTGATGNIYAGLHELSDMAFVLHFLRPGDLFLDIGANVGTYTVLASGVARARTWAFEPATATVAHLRRNVALNQIDRLVTVHPFAVGAGEAVIDLTLDRDTMNRVTSGNAGPVQQVRQVALDDMLGIETPSMMKVDVEGYEPEVLKGAARMLGSASLQAVAIETVTPHMEQTLAASGFSRMYYDPFRRELSASPNAVAASNALFVRDAAIVAERVRSARPLDVLGVTV